MVTRRTAKNKGASFEYDCLDSLRQIYERVYLTKELGYQEQYDIKIEFNKEEYVAVECKFHRSMSWNKAKKLFNKLRTVSDKAIDWLLIYKTNQQPVLVMYNDQGHLTVREFSSYYHIPFIKHKSRRKQNE